ncbi:L,D-transpeptidase [Ideonella sp. BN130291]|uniref:L,D-transpeptidase n=1 Tax=Ideonella sp. BN130291 TaxID=3112940 RepID=UPI002E2643A8|nr:L,D-transpeptidase [Ideonella sp. BN130291]
MAALALPAAALPAPTARAGTSAASAPRQTPDAARLVQWITSSRDNQAQPFAIIDKRNARLMVYDAGGRLRGSAPVLLGLARGDDTVPGIGEKPLSQVKPSERTTPAGRFVAEHGTNLRKEDILWIDYDAAVSMHPVLTTNAKERRLHRLATPGVADNRISYGCVNVPKAFFSNVVLKTLSTERPLIYVLPETRSLTATFPGLAATRVAGTRAGLASAAPPSSRKQ